MHFPTLAYWLGEKPCAQCTRCERPLFYGEEVWRCNGETVCADCFFPFAREQLAPFCILLGEEESE